jgi:hypothetical protein
LVAVACGEPSGGGDPGRGGAAQADPPFARRAVVEGARARLAWDLHASDGGGRAWLDWSEGEPAHATVSRPGRFPILYEVGSRGISRSGAVYLKVPSHWNWSAPQVSSALGTGYTRVEASADDIELAVTELPEKTLRIQVTGRALEEGERIAVTYGAGPAGAIADRWAERRSRFWIGVDGDGDGAYAFLTDSPAVDVLPGAPRRLLVTLPSVARPGEVVRVVVAVLDHEGDSGLPFRGVVTLQPTSPGLDVARSVALEPDAGGRATLEATVRAPGIHRLQGAAAGGLRGQSNPLVVSGEEPRVLWADLHGHTNFSDGTGTPEDYFRYARDVAGLDVVAITDHDHWGDLPLATHPEHWKEIQRQTRRFREPGRFVTLLGYEWTSWIHGHRHVLYFDDEGEIFSAVDPDYEAPLQLWTALEGKRALTFAHHSAGGAMPTNWNIPPDPVLEPLTEIVSAQGSSEASDSPGAIRRSVAGNFVRDALDRGYRLGFVGSGDSHDGHPGLAQLAKGGGGLAGIVCEQRTREAVLAALRARRVYATNGPRILLRVALGEHPMGSTLRAADLGRAGGQLAGRVVAVSGLDRVEVIRSGRVAVSIPAQGRSDFAFRRRIANLRPGEYLYVRAIQRNLGTAWSSPFFVE